MADSKSDIVMRFVDGNGKRVLAESTLGVLKEDRFMHGFTPITDYDQYSNFFEVTSFNFGMAAKPDDQGVGAMSKQQATNSSHTLAATDGYSRWRSAKGDDYKTIKFAVEFDTFSFSRIIDRASPGFFEACCNQDSFDSAVLVKRVSTGGQGGTLRQSLGFLRFDFWKVMLTGINWDDGDLVTESCTFICRKMTVRYKQQGAAGGLNLGVTHAEWPREQDRSIRNPGDE